MPAVRGAVGHGRNAIGGSTVRYVTNLNDSGAGSLRAAAVPGSVIVFQVAGTIVLQTPIELRGDVRMTFAFQTAPGDGIQLRLASLSAMLPLKFNGAQNFIIRGLRSRNGILNEGGPKIDGTYCLHLIGCEQFYIDHSSFSFSDDTAVQFKDTCKDGTFADNIISWGPVEGLNQRGTTDTIPPAERISVLRNVFANTNRRLWNCNYSIASEYCNNVIQNYREGGSRIAGAARVDYRGNVAIPGLDTNPGTLFIVEQPLQGLQIYNNDNIVIGRPSGHTFMSGHEPYLSTTPVGSSGYALMPSGEVVAYVETHAGPLPTDTLDERVLGDIGVCLNRWITHEREVGGLPVLTGTTRTQAEWDAIVIAQGGLEEALESFYAEEIVRFVNVVNPFPRSYRLPVPVLIHASLDAVTARVVIEGEVLTLPFFISSADPDIKIATGAWNPNNKRPRTVVAEIGINFSDGDRQNMPSVVFTVAKSPYSTL